MPLIGTAGHVDHGKSTLLQALTGRDPDRLEEEKARGLTIDLGFAWADLGSGEEVSFVDVPGHERYLKNMLAGIEAIDVALLVVDANEGWMPQTEEHVAILSLLGIESGVVAITKIDTVDSDIVDLATLEVSERLEATSLAGSPIVPVSAVTGSGLDEIRQALVAALGRSRPPRGPARLWIDRTFTVAGTGTVVTGSLLGGSLSVGDELVGYPGNETARVRTIQSHERSLETARPGFRVALGLSGLSVEDLPRGTMVTAPNAARPTKRFVVEYELARYVEELPQRGAFQIHVGTSTRNVRLSPAEGTVAVLAVPQTLPLVTGDRFIIRDTGRRLVVAGGRVLDPHPSGSTVSLSTIDIDPDATPDTIADQLLAIRGSDRVDHLEVDSGGGRPVGGIEVSGWIYAEDQFEALQEAMAQRVETFHEQHPLREGISIATLADQLRIEPLVAEEAVRQSVGFTLSGPIVASIEHAPEISETLATSWEAARMKLEGGLDVPTVDELGLPEELVHLLIRRGDLVRVSANLVYLPNQVTEIQARVRGLEEPFGVGDAKEALGLSRKYAVPILEWLDDNNLTIRRTDGRFHGIASTSGEN